LYYSLLFCCLLEMWGNRVTDSGRVNGWLNSFPVNGRNRRGGGNVRWLMEWITQFLHTSHCKGLCCKFKWMGSGMWNWIVTDEAGPDMNRGWCESHFPMEVGMNGKNRC
jgi:hypothetical protein